MAQRLLGLELVKVENQRFDLIEPRAVGDRRERSAVLARFSWAAIFGEFWRRVCSLL